MILHLTQPSCGKRTRQNTAMPFTLSEMMMGITVMTIMVAATLPFTIGITKAYIGASTQNDVQVKADVALEYMKKDLQGTSRSEILFTPRDGSGYRAFSLPALRRPLGTVASPFDAGGNIIWTETVVYHLYGTDPAELRRTVIKPFNATRTLAERQQQLDTILREGNGLGTSDGGNAFTQTILKGVNDFYLGFDEAEFDAYDRQTGNSVMPLGVYVLSPGNHAFCFTLKGKNPNSSGYEFGMDLLSASPSGSAVEGEYYVPALVQSGANAFVENMSAYANWSNNSQLSFPASGDGAYFTMPVFNDTWMDKAFTSPTAVLDKAKVTLNPALGENVVEMIGNDLAWDAMTQTGATREGSEQNYLNTTVRVLIGGADALLGGSISTSGQQCRVTFTAHPNNGYMNISNAFIMERESGFSGKAETVKPLTFASGQGMAGVYPYNNSLSVAVMAGFAVTSDFCDLAIDSHKDYLVSFHLDGSYGGGDRVARYVPPPNIPQASGTHAAYLENENGAKTGEASWAVYSPVLISRILAVTSLFVTYPDTATYTSMIYDTKVADPMYATLTFHAANPGNTGIIVKARAGDDPTLADASSWSAAPSFTAPDTTHSLGGLPGGQYIQYQATLTSSSPYTSTPSLKDVVITWPGPLKAVDLSASVNKGPNKGKFNLMIDGNIPPVTGVHLQFKAVKTLMGDEFDAAYSITVEPRNP